MNPWTRTQLTGLLLVAGALVFLVARVAMLGADGPVLVILGVALVLTLVATLLAWRLRTGGAVAATVIIALLLAANLPGMLIELAVPASVLDFGPNLVVLVGALLAVVAGVAAVIARRGDAAATADRERRIGQVVVAGLVLAVVASGVLTVTSRESVAAADAAGATRLVMADFTFEPEDLEATAGDRLLLVNEDSSWHSFTIDELDLDVVVLPGSEELVTLPTDAGPGSLTFYCRPHSAPADDGRDGMAGTLQLAE